MRCVLDGNFLSVRVSLDGWEGRAAFTPPPDAIDNAILQALLKTPFASVQELATSMCILITTIWRRLTGSFGFAVKHLQRVPHSLTEAQRQIQIDRSIELLRSLESAQANEWQSLMTLDESWFYLSTSHEKVSIQAGQQPPETVKHMIGDRKMIVAIVWNPQGFHLVDVLPKGQKFNANYYIDRILRQLLENRSTGRGSCLIIHADNARPHTARKIFKFYRQNRLEMASHLSYSPGLAPSDFFLFGHVKHILE
jgi:hypothetical protein